MKKILLISIISLIDIVIFFVILFLGLNYVGRSLLTGVYYLPVNNVEDYKVKDYISDELYNNKIKDKKIYYYGVIFKESFPDGYDVELVVSDSGGLPKIMKADFVEDRPLTCKDISGVVLGIFFGLILIEILSIYYIIKF